MKFQALFYNINNNNNNNNSNSEVLLGAIIHRPDAPLYNNGDTFSGILIMTCAS